MKIVIKATRIKLTLDLKRFIEEKIGGLERFCDIFQSEKYFDPFFGKGKPRSEAWVEIEKTTRHHRKGPIFRAEAQIGLPGKKTIRAEAENKNLKSAIVEIKDELRRQLKRYQQKRRMKYKNAKRQRETV